MPIHRKSGNQYVETYRPASLLPICSIYSMMFPYVLVKNTSENQSGFKLVGSCVNQLLGITHEVFFSFDDNCEVTGAFLGISKAFDKVWHKRIIHKVKRNGMSGNLLSFLTELLRNRKQRVILDSRSLS